VLLLLLVSVSLYTLPFGSGVAVLASAIHVSYDAMLVKIACGSMVNSFWLRGLW